MANEAHKIDVAGQGPVPSKSDKRILASFFVTFVAIILPTVILEDQAGQHIFSVLCSSFLYVALFSSIFLLITNYYFPVYRRLIIGSVCIIGFSEMCIIGAWFFRLKVSALVAIILPLQMLLVLGMVALHGTRDANQHYNANYEPEINNISELSLMTKTLSLGLLSALILMDEKNISDHQKRQSQAYLSMTYLATMLCLCPVMISCMPLAKASFSSTLVNILKAFNHATLVALAGVAIVLAAEFLNELVVLSITPLLVACLAFVQFGGLDQLNAREADMDFIKEFKAICVGTVAILYYAILVAAHGTYMGEKVTNFFKVFVYILLVAIISGLILTPQVLRPATSHIPPIVINVLCCDAVLMFPVIIYAATDTKIRSKLSFS